MPVKRCVLNGLKIQSLPDIYDALAASLSLPRHFGRNLDALWDALSADVEGPFEILWKNAAESRKFMGRDFERVVKVLRKLEEERGDFQLKIEK